MVLETNVHLNQQTDITSEKRVSFIVVLYAQEI
jgi:hypothetical protein